MHIPTIRRALFPALLTPFLIGCTPDVRTAVLDGESEMLQPFSIAHHAPPRNRQWITCRPAGQNEARMQNIDASGGRIALNNGHVLTVHAGAVSNITDFVFAEPESRQIVVYASGPGPLSAPGVVLALSWANRPDCIVPSHAVIARIVPGGTAEELRSRSDARAMTIQTVDPLLGLSVYALAR